MQAEENDDYLESIKEEEIFIKTEFTEECDDIVDIHENDIKMEQSENSTTILDEPADAPLMSEFEVEIEDCEKEDSGEKKSKRKDLIRPYICSLCNKSYCKMASLGNHMKQIHKEDKPFKCEVCNESFTSHGELKKHIDKHKGKKIKNTAKKMFYCSICNKSFLKSSELTVHMQEKSYSCELCGKRFTHKASLILHKKTDTGGKPFNCDFLNKYVADNNMV